MENEHKKILQRSYVFMTNNIQNVMDVCDYLMEDEILTSGMVDTIKHKTPAPKGQVRELMNILPRRGKRAYESFVNALIKSDNKDAADHLRQQENPDMKSKNEQTEVNVKKPEPPPVKIYNEGKTEENIQSYQGGGEKTKTFESPVQNSDVTLQWPDVDHGLNLTNEKDIQKCSDEELHKILNKGEVYEMIGKKKGKVVIISNVSCVEMCTGVSGSDENKETGAKSANQSCVTKCNASVDFDNTSIQQLFKALKFESKAPWKDLSGEEMIKKLKENVNDKDFDSLVVVFLSGGLGYEPGEIYDKDGKKMPREDIMEVLRNSSGYRGKPKVVIIRTYSFEEECKCEPEDTMDASKFKLNISVSPNNDDLFVVSSRPKTRKGPWIVGEKMNGSYFIQAFIHVMRNHAHDMSFMQMMEEVNNCLHTAMVPIDGKSGKCTPKDVAEVMIVEHCKNKPLYFFPGQINKGFWPDYNMFKKGIGILNKKDIMKSDKDFYGQISRSGKEFYDMIFGKRGKVIWISNSCCAVSHKSRENLSPEENQKLEDKIQHCRIQIDFDKTNMDNLFKGIGFDSRGKEHKKNITKEEMKSFLTDVMKQIDEDTQSQYSSLVLIIISGKINCQATEIYDINGELVQRSEILDIIKDCKHFKGKPKIVFIQSYSFKEEPPYDTTDSVSEMQVYGEPNKDDLFVVSTCPRIEKGPWMIGKNLSGSYFIQALIHVFKKQAHNKSFWELLQEVHKLLSNAAIPVDDDKVDSVIKKQPVADVVVLEHSIEKALYFFPGLKYEDISPGGFSIKGTHEFASSSKGNPVAQPSE